MQLLFLSAPRGPETKEDEAGSPSHTGPEPLGALREKLHAFSLAAASPSPSLGSQWAWVHFGRGPGERVGNGHLGCTFSGGSQRCAPMLTHLQCDVGQDITLFGSWCPYGSRLSQPV